MILLRFQNLETSIKNIYLSVKGILKAVFIGRKKVSFPNHQFKKDAIVLGSGPSMKNSLLKHKDQLKNKTLIAVNHFPKTKEYEELKPEYLVLLSRLFWEYNPDKEEHGIYVDFYNALIEKTTWPITIYIDKKASKKAKEIEKLNSNIKFLLFNKNGIEGFDNIIFPIFSTGMASPKCQNVLVASCYLAATMKFRNIFLLGADHSWIEQLRITDNNELSIRQIHYYDNQEEIVYKPYLDSERHTPQPWVNYIYGMYKLFDIYHMINRYAQYKGAKIINSSEYSYIDAFERSEIK